MIGTTQASVDITAQDHMAETRKIQGMIPPEKVYNYSETNNIKINSQRGEKINTIINELSEINTYLRKIHNYKTKKRTSTNRSN